MPLRRPFHVFDAGNRSQLRRHIPDRIVVRDLGETDARDDCVLGVYIQPRRRLHALPGSKLSTALTAAGADADFLNAIQQRKPWLVEHLPALASRATRPAANVPVRHLELLDALGRQPRPEPRGLDCDPRSHLAPSR